MGRLLRPPRATPQGPSRRTPTMAEHMNNRTARLAWPALAAAVGLLVTGCGGLWNNPKADTAKVGYTIPQEICGVPVDPNLIRPLLRPGKQLKAMYEIPLNNGKEASGCALKVD